VVAPLPLFNETAWNTVTPYTTGTTNAGTANLYGNIYVDLGKNNGTNASPSTSYLSVTGGLAAGSTSSGQTGSVVMGFASTNAPTATTADTWPLSISPASGGVRIDLKDTAANTNPFLVNPGTAANWGVQTQGSSTSGQSGNLVQGAVTTAAPTDTTAQTAPLSLNTAGALRIIRTETYPDGATPLTASATGTTAATTATLTPVGTTTMYICGFSIRANATAAATGNATTTGTITGTLNWTQWTAPLASGVGVTEEIFTPCVPGSSTTTAIAVVSAAPGTGGTVSVTSWGYYK
jgi:hypothetical protein